jgi:hypothetical protein
LLHNFSQPFRISGQHQVGQDRLAAFITGSQQRPGGQGRKMQRSGRSKTLLLEQQQAVEGGTAGMQFSGRVAEIQSGQNHRPRRQP